MPEDLSAEVHAFDAVEGGRIRNTLSNDDPVRSGKSDGAPRRHDADPGGRRTLVTVRCDGLPDGLDLADNETSTRMALDRLAALVEEPLGGGPILGT